ncbi:MAG: LPS assembly lipoprotein LptE [Dysgonamonadaceae bacterium]|nr:LPS assembly lipoprotein LptE [Dysgonamonadaceae bacterium]
MKRMRGKNILSVAVVALFFSSCAISYSFQGGKLNYDIVKTITIHDFPNRAPLVYPPLSQVFDQALRDRFIAQTRLLPVTSNGDIEIEGEIVGYDIQGEAIKDDAYASQTRLTVSVRLKYTNNKEANSDVDQTFSAYDSFSSTRSLDEVQDELIRKIVDELIDMIYNATVANW